MSVMQTVREYIVQEACIGAVGALGIIAAWFKRVFKRQSAIEKGMRSMMKEKITRNYSTYKAHGKITVLELESMKDLHDDFVALGGDDKVIKILIAKLEKLEIIPSDELTIDDIDQQ